MTCTKKMFLILSLFCLMLVNNLLAQPNFVIILSDDMGWTGSSVAMSTTESNSKSGFYFTPNIDSLIAKKGMVFSQAYAAAPKCSPSRCSFLTGQTTARNGFTETGSGFTTDKRLIPASNNSTIDLNDITIAEWLKSTGQNYRTAHFGKWHLGAGGPADNGFDYSDGNTNNAEGDTGGGAQTDPKKIFDLTTKGIDFVTQAKNDGVPFYLQISHWAVHSEIEAQQATIDLYNNPVERPPDPNNTHTNPIYAAMTEDMDTGIGLLLQEISRLGLEEDTYIVFMSDNGAANGQSSNSPLRRGKSFLYEGGIRVPFMIKGPNIPENIYSNEPIVSYDLFPTIASISGIDSPLPADLDGIDCSPLFFGNAYSRSESIYFHSPHYSTNPAKFPVSVAVENNYKFRVNYDTGLMELFDLDNEIEEITDISSAAPLIKQNLWIKLRNHLKVVNGNMPSLDPAHADFSGSTPDVDNDGLEDEWEIRELLSFQFGPTDDPDEDGLNNLIEMTQGTDPLIDENGTTSINFFPPKQNTVQLFPNPTKGLISFSSKMPNRINEINAFQLLTVNGQILQQGKITALTLDLSIYPKGVYFVKFIFGNSWEIQEVVKE